MREQKDTQVFIIMYTVRIYKQVSEGAVTIEIPVRCLAQRQAPSPTPRRGQSTTPSPSRFRPRQQDISATTKGHFKTMNMTNQKSKLQRKVKLEMNSWSL